MPHGTIKTFTVVFLQCSSILGPCGTGSAYCYGYWWCFNTVSCLSILVSVYFETHFFPVSSVKRALCSFYSCCHDYCCCCCYCYFFPCCFCTMLVSGQLLQQWVIEAVSWSTQYHACRDTWAACQTEGPPDTFSYSDQGTAWCALQKDGTKEFLILRFATAVYPTALAVRETYGNGFLTQIDLWNNVTATFFTVWTGKDPLPATQIADFKLEFLGSVSALVSRVKLYIDTSATTQWEEVDAVQLSGYQTSPVPVSNYPVANLTCTPVLPADKLSLSPSATAVCTFTVRASGASTATFLIASASQFYVNTTLGSVSSIQPSTGSYGSTFSFTVTAPATVGSTTSMIVRCFAMQAGTSLREADGSPAMFNVTAILWRLIVPTGYSAAGRIEVRYNNRWGTVCRGSGSVPTAVLSVACRSLGMYRSDFVPQIGSYVSQTTGISWFGSISCTGTENDLLACSHSTLSSLYCDHSYDLQMMCSPEPVSVKSTLACSPSLLPPSSLCACTVSALSAAGGSTYSLASDFSITLNNTAATLSALTPGGSTWSNLFLFTVTTPSTTNFSPIGITARLNATSQLITGSPAGVAFQPIAYQLVAQANYQYRGRIEIRYGGMFFFCGFACLSLLYSLPIACL